MLFPTVQFAARPFVSLVLAFVVSAGASAGPARPETPFHGLGNAKDGDSLMVGDQEVRLFGIR